MRLLTGLLLLLLLGCGFYACKPDDEKLNMSPSLRLSFDTDTLMFDTVFVQTGSATRRLWVYNNDRNAVNIERIELARASGEQFKLIINGQQTNSATNIRLRGNDSLQILVKVEINPDDQNQKFLVTDSIRFTTNGNLQHVDLVAYGQNAYFHYFKYESIELISDCPALWKADKPHVIYGVVGVPSGCTLKIEEGARVFVHASSGLIVGGTLLIEGSHTKRVSFQGDRREERFNDRPGQWLGIIFAENLSTTSRIRYADIKNAVYGIYMGSPGGNIPDLVMEQSQVRNMSAFCLAAFNSNVRAINCVFSNAGEAAVGTFIGGTYDFIHCTIANYSGFFIHDKPAAKFETRTKLSDGTYEQAELNLTIINSVIWGGIADEVAFASAGSSPATNLVLLNNVVRTVEHQSLFTTANGNKVSQINDFPKFKDTPRGNYEPDSAASPLVAAALVLNPAITVDVRGMDRPMPVGTLPDIGAYEVVQP